MPSRRARLPEARSRVPQHTYLLLMGLDPFQPDSSQLTPISRARHEGLRLRIRVAKSFRQLFDLGYVLRSPRKSVRRQLVCFYERGFDIHHFATTTNAVQSNEKDFPV